MSHVDAQPTSGRAAAPDRPEHELDAQGEVLQRNIRTMLDVRARYRESRSREARIADAITAFAGSMPFVYLHAAVFGLWLLINSRILPILPAFDPYPFVMLAMVASVEAIFLSTFVLVSQNRQAELGQKRDDLDLQINLLAEHEITKILQLVDEIARRMDVPREEHATEALKRDVAPETVLRDIERAEETPTHS